MRLSIETQRNPSELLGYRYVIHTYIPLHCYGRVNIRHIVSRTGTRVPDDTWCNISGAHARGLQTGVVNIRARFRNGVDTVPWSPVCDVSPHALTRRKASRSRFLCLFDNWWI